MNYYPIQLNLNVSYRELYPLVKLRKKIAFYWELEARNTPQSYLVIPDGCIDIIFNCSNNQIYVCPTLIRPDSFTILKGEKWFGMRFYPGVLAGLLRVKFSALQFNTIALEDINRKIEKQLLEKLSKGKTFEQRVDIANHYFICNPLVTDYRITETLKTIYESKGNLLLKESNQYTPSIGERQLRRLFHDEIGVSPKSLARIIRNQFMLVELKNNRKTKSFYDLYFDQSHMIREMKSLTSFTPKQIINQL